MPGSMRSTRERLQKNEQAHLVFFSGHQFFLGLAQMTKCQCSDERHSGCGTLCVQALCAIAHHDTRGCTYLTNLY